MIKEVVKETFSLIADRLSLEHCLLRGREKAAQFRVLRNIF
ncbi:hypothetical protein HMPREF1380_02088 [Enterococcus faecium R499]|nr:hypothetical protein HMPREF9525_01467 [Enterococcus faecium TX0133a04]EJX47914.1 hypothetical protein HMPREF1380_02088 [Enterococcus faecium R499]EJX61670.1 hypothetical protein HMPREF1374_02696 [Enterococcus faecium P1190]EJY25991.1 hypothetical protein HMPREF1355_01791 [Enterococcus faecium 515]